MGRNSESGLGGPWQCEQAIFDAGPPLAFDEFVMTLYHSIRSWVGNVRPDRSLLVWFTLVFAKVSVEACMLSECGGSKPLAIGLSELMASLGPCFIPTYWDPSRLDYLVEGVRLFN